MVARPFLWPGQDPAYPLGTDSLGRDVAAGVVWGTRVSLLVGFAAMLLGVTIGLVVGALAGYFGGRIDDAAGQADRDLPDAAELRAAGRAGRDRAAGDLHGDRRDRAGDLADRRAAGARRIPVPAREGLREGGARPRLRPRPHHPPRNPAQRAAAADRDLVGAGRDRDPDGIGAVVPGLERSQSW